MKIVSAQYLLTAVNEKQYPEEGLPEVALAGRSNVGKSSMINKLTNRRGMARTSSTPGKTRTLNFYLINEKKDPFCLVDLPGYGYAKVGHTMRNEWAKMMEKYITQRPNLKGVIQLIDLRHPPQKIDIESFDWFLAIGIPFFIVANKADKLSKNAQHKNLKVIRDTLGVAKEFPIIAFSKETGQGVEEVWAQIEKLFSEGAQEEVILEDNEL